MMILEIFKALLIGIVQGITEWLPVSSTGHMILVERFCSFSEKYMSGDFYQRMFLVVIQLGSIFAVLVLFFGKLNPFAPSKSAPEKKKTWSLWSKVIVGAIPAGVIGILLDDWLEAHLFTPSIVCYVIAAALLIYGVGFIVIERMRRRGYLEPIVTDTDDLTYKKAFGIGLFQVLSIIPGTSRSGSTILGGMLLGVSRSVAAEFSFFMALPIMAGASGLRTLKFLADGNLGTPEEWLLLGVAFVCAFVVSFVTIRFLMDFVKRHSFEGFGWYRIILAVLVLGFMLL